MRVLGPSLDRPAECEAILRSLPYWFGIEESLRMYARDSSRMPTFAVELEARLAGFVSLRQHFEQSWEVHCIAIAAQARGRGLGTRLLRHAENWLKAQGVRFLQVKTIAATKADEHYAETRAFYLARGYTPLEVFPALWTPGNPALQLVKVLNDN